MPRWAKPEDVVVTGLVREVTCGHDPAVGEQLDAQWLSRGRKEPDSVDAEALVGQPGATGEKKELRRRAGRGLVRPSVVVWQRTALVWRYAWKPPGGKVSAGVRVRASISANR